MIHLVGKKPEKFIVVSRGRSGTALLRGLLQSHLNIRMMGEQFGGTRVWHSPKKSAYAVLKPQYDNSPKQYLDDFVYGLGPIFVHVAGWNLQYSQYYHWKHDQGFDFIEYISDNQVKVVHLIRDNFVDTLLSNFLAIENDVWMKGDYAKPVKVSVERFHSGVATYDRDVAFFKEQFPEACVVYYNQLLSEDTHRTLLEFLGVPVVPLNVDRNTVRQRSKSQAEMLLNFDEVKESFRDTKYFDQFE
jgi:hypothetical protein